MPQDSAPITGGPKDRGQDTLLFASDQSLSYLTGELPADYGFDPLGLLDPEGKSAGFVTPAWLQYSEVIHARFVAPSITSITCILYHRVKLASVQERGQSNKTIWELYCCYAEMSCIH
jgi:hypothetical protein